MLQINWGIIGLGTIASTFSESLHYVPNANLRAVASRNINKSILFKEKYNANIAYGSYSELAKDATIDIVYIATPHFFHYENAKLCLEHGKAVLCEKPMGMNAEQTRSLCQIAKENNVLLMEAMWTAFLPNFQRLKELVVSEKFGKIKSFYADFGFVAPNNPEHRLLNKSLGGGSVLDIGIYPIFACLELLGVPKTITAKAIIGNTGVDLSCDMEFNYSNNICAKLKSTLTEQTKTEIIINFEKGTATLGPNFYKPTTLKTHSIVHNNTEISEKYSEGSGYQLEAIHFQELFISKKTESTIFNHKKSIRLATYLDIIINKINVNYNV